MGSTCVARKKKLKSPRHEGEKANLGVDMTSNPYQDLPKQSFWRTGVSETGVRAYPNFWTSKWQLARNARFSTYGSCFAQHISRELRGRKMNWVDAEKAPRRTPEDLARSYNYGVYSARNGNIYTTRQLLQWVRMASHPKTSDAIENWEIGGRFFDSLRPAIEPGGFRSDEEAKVSRRFAAECFAKSIKEAEVFVFTLGLTEGWENANTGQVYAVCPGTLAGTFDLEKHVFKNYRYREISDDLEGAIELMLEMNPDLRVLLTVSPVPLTATASKNHVLTATTYSKSVLRAVAGDLAADHPFIDYFPSYEVITGPPSGGAFYEDNLRSVAREGVDVVMGYFFEGLRLDQSSHTAQSGAEERLRRIIEAEEAQELICEEMALERENAG